MTDGISLMNQPLTLPCGAILPNRIAKAGLTERLCDGTNKANDRLVTLYRRWGLGGAGLLITGNVPVDRMHLESGFNLAIEDEQPDDALAKLAEMSAAAKAGGAKVLMQLNHTGRQTQKKINPTPHAPSNVPLEMGSGRFGDPVAMVDADIERLIGRFVNAAQVAERTGFDGIQIHAAHGYLISQFLSPLSNRRSDQWGGTLQGRARLLLECTKRIRAACPAPFIVSVKLNSADFQRGGFDEDDSAQVAAWLETAGCDLIEVSGGSYEQPRMIDFTRKDPKARKMHESTKQREAYFLDFVPKLRGATKMPIMVTGGFRSASAMASAVKTAGIDVIGLGRPLILNPEGARDILDGSVQRLDARDNELNIGRGIFGPNSPISYLRDLNAWSIMGWYYAQIALLADGHDPNPKIGPFRALLTYDRSEGKAAKALKR